jgi:membrane-associated protein
MDIDIVSLIEAFGYLGLVLIVFAESGLFFGFFLPGDSLLLTAGLLASRGKLDIAVLMVALPAAAITGDSVGYWFGKQTGSRIFHRENSLLFRSKNLLIARAFYEKHGGKTVILARFLPFIRTFAPIVAGAVEMRYSRFLLYNVCGGVRWGAGVTAAGYYLGRVIPNIDQYFVAVVAAVILLSAAPALYHALREYGPGLVRAASRRLSPARPTPESEAETD